VLYAVLEAAIQAGALVRNPAAGIRVPRSRPREMHVLSAAEVERLAEAIVPPYGLLVRFAAYTGLRAGELAALRVKRLDLLRGTVRVVESASEVGGRLVLGSTKTYAERTVRLPRLPREELAVYLAGRPRDPDGVRVHRAQGWAAAAQQLLSAHLLPGPGSGWAAGTGPLP
jgi:integrase